MGDTETHPMVSQASGRALAAVGLSEAEENTYLTLLEHPAATVAELADLLGLQQRRVGRVLMTLESKGMVTRSLDRDARFRPTPPEAAVEALIAQRQHQLDLARWHAERLAGQAREAAGRRSDEEIVEMVTGANAVQSCWERLHASATEEGLVFIRPSPLQPDERVALAVGVQVRAVYDRDGLEQPGAMEALYAHAAAGEQARVYSPLPVELVIVDRRAAMIRLVTDVPDAVALLLRPCGLLDALVLFFETIWEQASPFNPTAGEVDLGDGERGSLPADVERILPLLAVGLRDDCIARELGLSARTLDRRLRAMMRTWGAATRFQAGWLAATRDARVGDAGPSRGAAERQDDHG